jgi:hypothetical protein
MPSPHNHKWAKNKADKTAAFKECKEEATKLSGGTSANKKPKQDEAALKLALGYKFTSALVTQHHMSQADAESVFNSIYKDVVESKQENYWDRRQAVGPSIKLILSFYQLFCSSGYPR